MKLKTNCLRGFVLLFLLLASTAMVKADHSWGSYHWARSSNPFTLQLGDNLTNTTRSNWKSNFGIAIADWNKSTVLDTVAVAGGTRARRCAITGGRVEVCNSAYGQTGWLGVAGISVTNGHITGAYVKLNDTYSMNDAEEQLVMCQEIGHTFGLGHQDEGFYNAPLGTCMDYTQASTANQNMHPNQHDYDMLEQIYAHLDSSTTIGAMAVPAQVALGDYRSPRAWGRAVRFNKEGQAILFERDFGNGHKIFTHIYPVPGSRFYNDEDHEH